VAIPAAGLAIAGPLSAVTQIGALLDPQPVIQLVDASGTPVAQGGVPITASLAPLTGMLNGATTVTTDAAGIGRFANLSVTGTVGFYTFTFASPGLASVSSAPIQFVEGAPSQLALIVQPSATAENGVPFPQQPVVQLQDASGNPVDESGTEISTFIASGGGTLTGVTTVATANGVAEFADLAIAGLSGNRTLWFTAVGFSGVESNLIWVDAPLVVTTASLPPGVVGGSYSAPPLQAEGGTGTYTWSLESGPDWLSVSAGGVLSGTPMSVEEEELVTVLVTSGSQTATKELSIAVNMGAPSASQSSVAATSPITASNGESESTITVTVRNAFDIPISGATVTLAATGSGNTLTQPVGTTNASGQITGTLSSTAVGTKVVSATVNGSVGITQTASVVVDPAATTTAIVTHLPEPSTVGQAVTVTYTVTSAGGTPTGNVTVSDGTDSCVGTVAAGSCPVTLTSRPGNTLTATYGGDANFAGSVSPGVAHKVNP
jgi:hypothetical protein